MFEPLNLPPVKLEYQMGADGVRRVFDPLRRRFVALTPEEWVRQHFVAYLVNELGYPSSLMANEVAIKVNDTSRRCDTILYYPLDGTQGMRPRMVVEYKAPHIPVTQKVFDQIARYNSTLGAPLLIVSNGLHHYCCRYTGATYTFLRQIPPYPELLI